MRDFRSEAERLFVAEGRAELAEGAAFSAAAPHSPLQIDLLA